MESSSSVRRLLQFEKHLNSTTSSSMSIPRPPITSHVLDTSRGVPAVNMQVELFQYINETTQNPWQSVNKSKTNEDGRVPNLIPSNFVLVPGFYRMTFYTKEYFEANDIQQYFYPECTITFQIQDTRQHYHVPLLINPFGYSTYRGS
jgi:hydroxyisourate hydrolase